MKFKKWTECSWISFRGEIGYYMLINWDISCPVTKQEKQINITNKLKFIYYLTENSFFCFVLFVLNTKH